MFLLSYQFVIQTGHLGFKIVQLILLSSSQILPLGQKVQDPLCEKCSFPMLVYGRLVCITSSYLCTRLINYQRAKKVASDSLGLVDFNIVIRLVNFVLNLPYWQTNFFQEIHITELRTVINPAHEKFFFGLIKMTLVQQFKIIENDDFSLSCCAMSFRSHHVWRGLFDKFCPRSWGSRTCERTWERSTMENQV